MSFRFDASSLQHGLESLAVRGVTAVRMYAETAALSLQNHAQSHARWTDRTGAARQRLRGYVEPRGTVIRVNLAHGVDYGIWLELAHEKRFAIVQPTIDLKSAEVFRGLDRLLERIG